MKTIYQAQEALTEATKIIKELIMADKLFSDVPKEYSAFLDFWEEVYELDKLLDQYGIDKEGVKRVLIYDAMTEGEQYE